MFDARARNAATLIVGLCALGSIVSFSPAMAQVGLSNSSPFDQREIASVSIRITNPHGSTSVQINPCANRAVHARQHPPHSCP
jgi:hypothetical protein